MAAKNVCKLMAVLLVLSIISMCFLSGCSSDKASEKANDGKTAEDTSSGKNTDDGNKADNSDKEDKKLSGKLELAAFSNGEKLDNFWNAAVDEFKKAYPEVEVKLTLNPSIQDVVRPRFVGNNPPDLYYMGGLASMDETQLTVEGQFLDLKDWLADAESIGYDGLLKDSFAFDMFNSYQGGIYGMPVFYNVWGVYYNKKMAEENGWEAPTNWSEFEKLAPEIKDKGIYPIIHQGKYPDYVEYGFIQPAVAAAAGREALVDMANLKEGAYKIDAIKTMYQRLQVMRDKDYLPKDALALTHTEAQIQWLNGKAFLLPCGNWLEGEMAKDVPEGFEMGFMPSFMRDNDDKAAFIAGGARIAVAKKTKNPEAAKEFLRILFSKQVVRKAPEAQMGLMPIKESYDGIELVASSRDINNYIINGDVNVYSPIGGSFDPYGELRQLKMNNIAAMLGGDIDSGKLVEELEKEAQKTANDSSITKVEVK